ncbi:chitooligosaccharidolytic beta-N-acetylglucosaminidase-like [Eriocheir sinensis]|uniref:chitooligosaccharidolytic beta-N-acetylglucosaminidase-like n=1 Tax=Eriocheir sinensis TaxID=95602 RepID=UPI0021CA431B|nr:chitooligosaccharidolytic beta-N-acetylglucosaminidase-like [Eriocheir sinensis]
MQGLVVVMVAAVGVAAQETTNVNNFFKIPSPWGWACEGGGRCVKYEAAGRPILTTLNQCKLTCGPAGALLPLPSAATIGDSVSLFLPQSVSLKPMCLPEVCPVLQEAFEVFLDSLQRYHPEYAEGAAPWTGPWDAATQAHKLVVEVAVRGPETHLTLDTDESYDLTVAGGTTTASVTANTFFGARHGLETLSQLVEYHETDDALMVVTTAAVTDAPAFPYRGLLVDTSRNFVTEAALRRTLDAMAASKLNTLHWHITDSHSFPLALDTLPNMAYYGAYSPRQVYTPAQVRRLVQYARVRGVRLLPELDAPAHVGNGWQWAEKEEGLGRLAVCVNQEPWQEFCVEPPCGQLNLANPAIYDVLGHIYRELIDIFAPVDIFHYGGDEVNLKCWNTTEEIVTWMTANGHGLDADAYYRQWGVFQEKARQLLQAAAGAGQGHRKEVEGVLWTSELTNPARLNTFLNSSQYIIQIWSTRQDPVIKEALTRGYRVIFSNHDAWYLDCGAGAWVGEGNNWCSPYKGWQTMYDNSPHDIALTLTGSSHPGQILGGESAMWTEQADTSTIDSKVWPRAAAVAERLWTNPATGWRDAETRFIHHRQRLVRRGVQAERIQPQWCHQNEGLCYL